MIGINMPMPDNCHIGKKKCPLLDDGMDCKLNPDSRNVNTFYEQFKLCPLIDLSRYEDDGK